MYDFIYKIYSFLLFFIFYSYIRLNKLIDIYLLYELESRLIKTLFNTKL